MATRVRKTHFILALVASWIDAFKRVVAAGGAGGAVSGTSAAGGTGASGASGTAAVTGTSGATSAARQFTFTNPAASGVNVHAAIASDNAAPVTTALTNPAIPRSLQVVFTALWDGGDITVVGTDQFDAPVTEVIPDTPGATVQGVKVFKTVTSINNETVGAGVVLTATVQTGEKLGLSSALAAADGALWADGAMEAGTWDATYSAFTPTTAPNGAHDYVVLANVTHTHAAGSLLGPSHTHTGPSHTHGAGSFASAPASSAVHYDRGEYTVTAANATSLATSLALTKALILAYGEHIVDDLAHDALDATNTVASAMADVIDLATAIVAANQIKAAHNAHRAQSGVHRIDDAAHETTSADATDQSSLNTLVNELKTDFNAHIADGVAAPSWRMTDG